MFYDVVVNEWDETTYVPTALGNVCLAVILIALLVGAVLFARKYAARQADNNAGPSKGQPLAGASGRLTAKQLAFCAVSIALGTILSNIKLFHFPTGGSITLLSMLVICLPGYFFGLGTGLLTGIAYGILQLLTGPYVLYPMQLVIDYIFAFGALGLSGVFANSKNGLIKGYLMSVFGRYVFAVVSGWIFFGTYAWDGWAPLPYSLIYNAIYIFSEAAITVIILCIPAVKNGLARVKTMALT